LKRDSALSQPLVTRPGYGRERTVAESGLPSGGPSDKGLPVDSGIPGTQTFAKPVDDIREFDKAEDKSIYRTDNADDLLTKRDRIDVREDNANKPNGIGEMGLGKPDPKDYSKTKYPYRDNKPNDKNASDFVAQMWLLRQAHSLRLSGGVRVAAVAEEILDGLNPKFQARADKCFVTTSRTDVPNLRWIFSVDCGNGAKVVKMKASRVGTMTRLSRMDLDLKCSCPAWRWLGPEHHAKNEEYLDGRPRGTASEPVVRDPTGINRVCKHVAAVLGHTRGWTVPKRKQPK